MRWDHVGTRKLHPDFGAHYWACTSPVNASRTALLSLAHDSGPEGLAGPALLGTCTPSIVPVLIGAPQRPAFSRALRENNAGRSLLLPKCQRPHEASAAQRLGWNAVFGGSR